MFLQYVSFFFGNGKAVLQSFPGEEEKRSCLRRTGTKKELKKKTEYGKRVEYDQKRISNRQFYSTLFPHRALQSFPWHLTR
uniref:Secreted protein n=1 Tax=Caenorhabditis tropicalis TaxID=1561998 RepID=A0A1I7UM47_9PELO